MIHLDEEEITHTKEVNGHVVYYTSTTRRNGDEHWTCTHPLLEIIGTGETPKKALEDLKRSVKGEYLSACDGLTEQEREKIVLYIDFCIEKGERL